MIKPVSMRRLMRTDRSAGTTILFFHAENNEQDVRQYPTGSRKNSVSYASVEYGSFFIIPVTASDGSKLDILGVLKRESDGALKSKYATFRSSPPAGEYGLTEFLTGEISLDMDTVTSVDAGFTTLYTTKPSFAALEDQLFIAQGEEMYSASLDVRALVVSSGKATSLTFDVGALAKQSFGREKVKVDVEFIQMTAVSILKVAADKFFVAVGDPADSSDTGKVVVFEGATLSDLEQKFKFTGDAEGDWFGWSVKLQLLDRDPEPVLFIGAPKANGGKGLVKTTVLNPDTYRASILLPLGIPTFTYSGGDISVRAFGYSLQTITYNEDNFLIVGAPETHNGEGAVFFYKLDTTNGKFALQQAFFVGNRTGLTTGVNVKMKDAAAAYNKHFGASVGAFLYNNTPYFYAASYKDANHTTGTALHFFQRQDDSTISQFLQGDQPYGEVYDAAEYGAFFILPVTLWRLTYENITEWYKTEAEAEESKSGISGSVASDSMDVFALLKSDGSLIIKPFSPEAGRQGFIALSGEEFDISASLPTLLADGFTRLYSASKVSILSWENRLFVVQGTGIKTQSFSSTVLLNPFVTSLNTANRASQVNPLTPLTLRSADEQIPVIGKEKSSGFTKITAISVLRTTDKFYLALGDPADDTTIGKVAVFEGSDSAFSDIKQTFEVLGDNAGDWFGWSVKLSLLDRDGVGSASFPEPVLFVGAPKATVGGTSGVGYVKVFAFDETVIQTLTPADVTAPVIKAFGYSLDAKSHPLFRFSHLIVGAPETNSEKGAIFIYRWQDRQYVLKGVFAIGAIPTGVSGRKVTLKDGAYNKHFGAEVGAFYFDSTFPRFYAVSYDSGHTGTSIQFFFSNASGGKTGAIRSTVYSGVEYGSFFTIPVKVWKIEGFLGEMVVKEFFASREEAIKRSFEFDRTTELSVKTVSLDILGVLKREEDGSLKSKYATFYPVIGSLTTFLSGAIPINTGTSVDAGFTTLYKTNNKLSFAALPDQLFFAQGTSVYRTSFTVNRTVMLAVEKDLKPVVLPTVVPFTQITAIDVLKFENKFYLAVGEATVNINAGRAVVFEGPNAEFSNSHQIFEVPGDNDGDWFGWSVKLGLLDRDGTGGNPAEPVLFVGAPKANSGIGTVKVFAFDETVIQTLTPADITVPVIKAFGYSLDVTDPRIRASYLIIGAPASEDGSEKKGAVFVYKWKIDATNSSDSAYELRSVFSRDVTPEGSSPYLQSVHIQGGTYDHYLGAEVGAFYMGDNKARFYASAYATDRSAGTTILFFHAENNEQDVLQYPHESWSRKYSSSYTGVEYGSFFIIPVTASVGSELDILGVLFRESDGDLKIKYATFRSSPPWGVYGLTEFLTGEISLDMSIVTSVDAGFTTLYATKPSFAALPDQLFIAQGDKVLRASLYVPTKATSLTFTVGDLAEQSFVKGELITAIDVLKFENKFYLAVGEANARRAVVFEGRNAEFSQLKQTFRVTGPALFGWSVKLQLLDRDGMGGNPPEPVLFVGAPKANSGVGTVKVFAFDETVIQTLTPAGITRPVIKAFGYSLDVTDPRIRASYLIIGAPASEHGGEKKGAVFVYKWKISDSAYDLRAVFSRDVTPAGSSPYLQSVRIQGGTYDHYLGASVGAFYMGDNKARFYASAYDENRTGTTILFFHAENNEQDVRQYPTGSRKHSVSYASVEYGSFFIIPVTASDGSELDILGVLFRESDGALKSKYATFRPPPSGVYGFTEFLAGAGEEISLDMSIVTPVDAGFTTLYETTNKLSFAALTDRLFIAQGDKVYSASLDVSTLVVRSGKATSLTFTVGDLAEQSFVGGKVKMEFTQMTAVSILKVAADKFFVALGDPADTSYKGKVVVYEGPDSEFDTLTQKFDVQGEAEGDWFGWSVKLQLLDRDGAAGASLPEPVLFVGAPKAPNSAGTSGVGYVKVFTVVTGSAIQTLTPPPAHHSLNIRAFGYSLDVTDPRIRASYLIIGAPASAHIWTNLAGGHIVGGVFIYKWERYYGRYDLKSIFSKNPIGSWNTPEETDPYRFSVHLQGHQYGRYLGTEVGAFYMGDNKARFYASAYNPPDRPRVRTNIHFFHAEHAHATARVRQYSTGSRKDSSSYSNVEYGSFFIIPVTASDGSKLDILGVLFRESDGALRIKYATFRPPPSGVYGFTEFLTGAISLDMSIVTSVDAGFTTLYETNNKLSFAAVEDKLFIAQGDKVYSASLDVSTLVEEVVSSVRKASSLTFTVGDLAEQSFVREKVVEMEFTQMTAISILKVATDKFYLALGDPADSSDTGKVVVFEGTTSTFANMQKTFEVPGDNEGDWFGWSVKLGLLDRDGAAGASLPEPVLFVGAPKAPNSAGTSGVGYVKVFTVVTGSAIQTLTPPRAHYSLHIRAFGYSLDVTDPRIRASYLIIGAPASAHIWTELDRTNIVGGVFIYQWEIADGAYDLKSIFARNPIRGWNTPSPAVNPVSPHRFNVRVRGGKYRRYLGTDVGAFYMGDNKARFYASAYDPNRRLGTTILFFHAEHANYTARVRQYSAGSRKYSVSYTGVEYGSFFIIPVTASDGSELDILGVLFRESNGALKIKYATFRPPPPGVFGLTEFLTGAISLDMNTVTAVDDDFTTLYKTNNKLSFAALPDKLFIAQGDKVLRASLYVPTKATSLTFTVGDLAEQQSFVGEKVELITAISVLKESANKFYLAVGKATDTNDRGKVAVFEAMDSAFSTITHKFTKFGDNDGDWFGWSVKLGLLDRDGTGGNPAEPVLFVGAPRANSGVGTVKVFAFDDTQTVIQTLTPAGITVPVIKAFGYSLDVTDPRIRASYLIIGAPASEDGSEKKGAVFAYMWKISDSAYELRSVFSRDVTPEGSSPYLQSVHIQGGTYDHYLGAEVGAFYMGDDKARFYASAYATDRSAGTTILFFHAEHVSDTARVRQYPHESWSRKYSSSYTGVEYGSFFIIPVTASDGSELDILGVLFRESDGALKSKYATFRSSPPWGEYGLTEFLAGAGEEISLDMSIVTSVDAGFTTLYATKPSFAALPDQLFIAQGDKVYSASLVHTLVVSSGKATSLTFTVGDLAEQSFVKGELITAISVLKFAADKFYLAVGEANAGRAVVFEGTNAEFSDIEQTFRVTGSALFGWSVKLSLLDRDGGGAGLPEPVLFVGAPRANSESGTVKVFDIGGGVIQTIRLNALFYVRAFGYSLGGGIHERISRGVTTTNSYLIVGAPASTHNSAKEGAAFVYKWNNVGAYELKGIARPTEGSHGGVGSAASAHPSGSVWEDATYKNHFGASVGYANFGSEPHLYVVSYNSGHTETAISVFGVDNTDALLYRDNLTSVHEEAYGAFFTLSLGQVEGFGFLVRESGDLKIKYGVMRGDIHTGRINYQIINDTPIDTGTSVLAKFTDLYAATNKLSFAVLTDTLFVAQGANVYSASFAFNPSSTIQTLTIGVKLSVTEPTFTGITAIDVLKESADKFYLAVGEAGGKGKVTVYEGPDSEFSTLTQTFKVEGARGEWFGWSVKLQLLDRDGGGAGLPEPVLFVGAPKASGADGITGGVGTVKVFDISGGDIQTITPPAFSTSYVRAFGYSLAGGIHSSDNYLIVGAPASNSLQEGAAFVYAWNGSTAYDLKAIARPTEGSYGNVLAGVKTAVVSSRDDKGDLISTPWNLYDHNSNFGVSVGYLLHQTRPYFYVVSYNSDRTKTAMTAFSIGAVYIPGRSKIATGEYGTLFTLPVVHSTQTHTILGFLFLDSNSGNLKIKYGVVNWRPGKGGVDFQETVTGVEPIEIDTVTTGTGITNVDAGFTTLYDDQQ